MSDQPQPKVFINGVETLPAKKARLRDLDLDVNEIVREARDEPYQPPKPPKEKP